MLTFLCQDLDRGSVLVHAAAVEPFFGLTDVSVDHHQMCSHDIKGRRGVGLSAHTRVEISLQLLESPDD